MDATPEQAHRSRRWTAVLLVFRLSPVSFSFFAGILVSVATNLYTSVLLTKSLPSRPLLYGAVIVFAGASLALIVLSVILEDLRGRAGAYLDAHLRTNRFRLIMLGLVGCFGLVLGFLLLFLGTRV